MVPWPSRYFLTSAEGEKNTAKPNILYIHGFGSQVDPDDEKQVALRKIAMPHLRARIFAGAQKVLAEVESLLQQSDLLTGTSMGGFLDSRLSDVNVSL